MEQELLTRLPGWRMSRYAPHGWRRPAVSDGGLAAEPFDAPERMAAAATLTVSCPSFPIGTALPVDYPAGPFTTGLGAEVENTHPVVPFAITVAEPVPEQLVALANRAPFVTVLDAGSRERLLAAGVERDVVVVAHPAVLLDRVVDLESLPERVAQLRQLDVLPAEPYDVTDDWTPDLVLEDRLAVLAGARSVTTTDEHIAAACAGLGVPGFDRPDVDVLTAQLDRLAELAEATLAEQGGDLERRTATLVDENHALRQAHWRLRQRLLVERQRLAEPLAQAWQERDAATAEAKELLDTNVALARRNEELAARLAHVEQELASWQNTKLVRWTRPLRDAYGKARG
jgi:regulator of replication initiation timing